MKYLTHWFNGCLIIVLLSSASGYAGMYLWTGAVSSEWDNPANWNPTSGVPGPGDTVVVDSGSPSIAAEVTVAGLELSWGVVTGAGTLTVTNAFVWSGVSSMQGGGRTVIEAGATATLSGTGDRSLRGRALINQATLAHAGSCRPVFWDRSQLENGVGGVVDLQGDGSWVDGGGVGPSSLTNRGTFLKSGGTGTSTIQNLAFDNAGLVEVAAGTMEMAGSRFSNSGEARVPSGQLIHQGGGSSSGRWVVSGTGAVVFASGSPSLEAGARLEGLGTNWITGAT